MVVARKRKRITYVADRRAHAAIMYVGEQQSLVEIAGQLGVTKQRVHMYLRDLKIPMRRRGRPLGGKNRPRLAPLSREHCPVCEQRIRPCNMVRHIKARHAPERPN
jgi:hypothetical protein